MAWNGKRNPVVGDALSSAFLAAIVVIVARLVDAREVIAGWSRRHEGWPAGELPTAHLFPALAFAAFARGRSAEPPRRLGERRRAEEARRASE